MSKHCQIGAKCLSSIVYYLKDKLFISKGVYSAYRQFSASWYTTIAVFRSVEFTRQGLYSNSKRSRKGGLIVFR